AHADEKVAPSSPVIAEPGQEQLAERISEYAQGAERADADDRCAVAETVPAELLHEERRSHRQVCAAVVAGGVAAKEQRHSAQLRHGQRRARAPHGSGAPGIAGAMAVSDVQMGSL